LGGAWVRPNVDFGSSFRHKPRHVTALLSRER
jgi:hypothetical protein